VLVTPPTAGGVAIESHTVAVPVYTQYYDRPTNNPN